MQQLPRIREPQNEADSSTAETSVSRSRQNACGSQQQELWLHGEWLHHEQPGVLVVRVPVHLAGI